MAGKPDTRQVFFECVVEEVAQHGVESVRTKKIAERTGYAESLMYLYFKNKEDMLSQTFFEMDRRIVVLCEAYLNDPANADKEREKRMQEIWHIAFRFLTENRNLTLFLLRYRHSEYFTKAVKNKAMNVTGESKSLYELVSETFGTGNKANKSFILMYIFGHTLYLANVANEEEIEITPEVENAFCNSVFSGAKALMNQL